MPNPTPASALADMMSQRFYKYRGCAPVPAPDADFPGQALGDPGLSTEAWSADDAAVQRAAAAACTTCPVLDA